MADCRFLGKSCWQSSEPFGQSSGESQCLFVQEVVECSKMSADVIQNLDFGMQVLEEAAS